jgi:hypothetical protein
MLRALGSEGGQDGEEEGGEELHGKIEAKDRDDERSWGGKRVE